METAKAMLVIEYAITEINAMVARDANSERFTYWRSRTTEALTALLGEDSLEVKRFTHILYRIGPSGGTPAAAERLWQASKELAKQKLCDALIDAERSTRSAAQTIHEAPTSVK